MKLKPLPLIEKLSTLPGEDYQKTLQTISRDFFASPFAQLLAETLRQHERAALSKLRSESVDHDEIQRLLGRIHEIEELRRSLAFWASNDTPAEWADEESEEFLPQEQP